MSAGKGVVFALQWSREWTDAVQFAVGAEVVPAPRQYLVAVSWCPTSQTIRSYGVL